MDRVNGANWVDIGGGSRGFRDEDVVAGVTGTDVPAVWLNALQENIMGVIERHGLAGDIDDWELLWKALQIARAQSGAYRSAEAFANDPPGAPQEGETWIVGATPTGAFVGHENELAEWSGTGWSFIAPTPWMLIGLADRTDWRWDTTLPQPAWVRWAASEAVSGPVLLASAAEVSAGVVADKCITPAHLHSIVNAAKSIAFTPAVATTDINTPYQAYVMQSIAVTGTRYVDAFGHVAFRNNHPTVGCDCQTWIRLAGEPGQPEYIGLRPSPGDQVPGTSRRFFSGLDPALTYTIELIAHKSEGVGPIAILDPLLTLIHE
ncbi:MAG: DUF2793 domain-containing protein [Phyllobacteriaceae bacterium]|nr:DUF2793 domain-containing protein [Phyllobacteriaceae bacterium]